MNDFLLHKVRFQVDVSAAPWKAEEQFVHEFKGLVVGMGGAGDEEVLVGTMKLMKVSTTEAMNRGMSLLNVCDAVSQFLFAVFDALFENDEELKDELKMEAFWSDILVIWEVKIRRAYRHTSAAVDAIETAIAFFGPQSIIVAPRKILDTHGLRLTIDEWRKLGFVKLAGQPFVIREQAKPNPYGDSREQGNQ